MAFSVHCQQRHWASVNASAKWGEDDGHLPCRAVARVKREYWEWASEHPKLDTHVGNEHHHLSVTKCHPHPSAPGPTANPELETRMEQMPTA